MELNFDLIEFFLGWSAVVKHLFCHFIFDDHNGKDRRKSTFDLQQTFEK